MKNVFNEECSLTLKKIAKILNITSYVTGDDMGNVFHEIPVYTETCDSVKVFGVAGGTAVVIKDITYFCHKGKLTTKLSRIITKINKSYMNSLAI